MEHIKNKAALLFLGVIAILSLYALPLDSKPVHQDDPGLVIAQKRSFEVVVNTIGSLDTIRSYMALSEIKGEGGKIVFLAKDGSQVDTGNILVRFNATYFEDEVLTLTSQARTGESTVEEAKSFVLFESSQVEGEIAAAKYELRMAELEQDNLVNGEGKSELAELEGQMEKAKQEFSRYEGFINELHRLGKKGYSNPAEIEQASEKKAQLEVQYRVALKKYESYQQYTFPLKKERAKAKLMKAGKDLEHKNKSGKFRVAKARAALDKAKKELETSRTKLAQARLELGKTIIKAPYPGIVVLYETFRDNVKRKPRIGDTVWQGQPILYLPDISSFLVKTKVREVDLHLISKGAPARIKVDAYPDALFSGKVLSIGALAQQSGAMKEAFFQAQIMLDGSDSRLRPGMTARAGIMVGKVENAITAPAAAIFGDGSQTFCYRQAGRELVKTPISIGRQNDHFVEVTNGLSAGDVISLLPPE